jgi:hypothetical protein
MKSSLGDQPCENGISSYNTALDSVAVKLSSLYNEIKGYQEGICGCNVYPRRIVSANMNSLQKFHQMKL